MTRRIRLVHDYFVRWPVKVDGCYDEGVRNLVSAELESDIEHLAAWWQDEFAVPITDPPTESRPEAVIELQSRTASILERLSAELGSDDEIDPR